MRRINLLLVCSLFIGCSKQSSFIAESNDCKSATYFISHCDNSWKVIKTDTALFIPSVCGSELERLSQQADIKDSTTCPSNNITWLHLSPIENLLTQ